MTQRTEYEVKVAGTYNLPNLLSLGAELVGEVTQKDIYLALGMLSAEQAVVYQAPVARRIARNLTVALVIVAASFLAGSVVARLMG